MDGVLIDSEPLHVAAGMVTFDSLGIPVSKEQLQRNMGMSSRVLIAKLIEEYAITATMETVYPLHHKRLLRLYLERAEPMAGAFSAMSRFKNSGFDLGLASSSDSELIDAVLKKFDWSYFFGAVVSGEDVEKTKPSPDIFLEAALRLGCSPDECAVVEDSQAGVMAARRAAMLTVGFRSPNSGGQDLSSADLIIDDLDELTVQRLEAVSG